MSMKNFLSKPQEYILVWAGLDRSKVQYSGEVVNIPARDEVADPDEQGSIFRFGSAQDKAGNSIPGTIVLVDIKHIDNETGGEVLSFDAKEFAKGIYSNGPNHRLFDQGLEIVDSVEDVAKAKAENHPKWIKSKVFNAENTVREELDRLAYWEKRGQPAPVSSSSDAVRDAIAFLAEYRKSSKDVFSKAQLHEALGVSETPKPVYLQHKAVVQDDDASVDLEAMLEKASRKLYALADEHGVELKKDELKGLLDHDANIMASVQAKIEAKVSPSAEAASA